MLPRLYRRHDTVQALLLRVGATALFLFSTEAALSQANVTLPSNLDETANVTSRGGSRGVLSSGTGPVALPEDFSQLRLGPGFKLQMSVYDVPEMSSPLRVDDEGNVSIALIGELHVADDTLHAAEQKIAAALIRQEMLVAPHVTLEITAFPQLQVVVTGEVQQPGKIAILKPRPVLDLIALSGGVTTAAGGEIEIHHPQVGAADTVQHIPYANGREPDEARLAMVAPGDTVFVRRAGVIYVLGAVNHPGGYLMVNGGKMTLPQAVSLAAGASPIAATKTAVIVRKGAGDSITRQEAPLKGDERGEVPPFQLQDGDMVYIPTSKIKAALINSSTILSSAASAAIYTAR